LCRGSRLATFYSKALKRLRKLQYVKRPGPDSGCSAIGWMHTILLLQEVRGRSYDTEFPPKARKKIEILFLSRKGLLNDVLSTA
jgi:hypothetical protein